MDCHGLGMYTSNGVTPECLPKGMLVAAWTGPVKGCRACVRANGLTGLCGLFVCACVASDEISCVCAGKARSTGHR